MELRELVIIGGGPAGLAAAVEAYDQGIKDILIIERDKELGGILQQCIHNGFGLHIFGEELTGPEYAWRFMEQVKERHIVYKLDTMVLDINENKEILAVNETDGLLEIKAKAIVLAMGCRERTRGALNIPGMRPSGIYTAGAAQRFVNMEGYLPGKKVVILGSGDIGLIMARRMTWEGAEVKMVCELLPFSGGLTRNIVQCLEDFNIPLKLSHTVTRIHGKDRLEGVTIAQVNENRQPIKGTEFFVECDTLLLSVGLIPENELSSEAGINMDKTTSGPIVNESMETSIEGVFACGNVVHVHDLVDFVTDESRVAGRCAATYLKGERRMESKDTKSLTTEAGNGVSYVIPHHIRHQLLQKENKLFFRVTDVHRDVFLVVRCEDEVLYKKKKRKLAPGEMESIPLTDEMIKSMSNYSKVTVEIQ